MQAIARRDSDELPPLAAVVIPVRDRAGARLRRSLASLRWQSQGPPQQLVVVSHGSRPEIDADLAALCADAGASFISIGEPADPWCKPLALNVGLRATDPAVDFVMTMDADMVLAPNFIEVVLETLREAPRRFVLCRSSDLPRDVVMPEGEALREGISALRARATLRGRQGTGGIQAAPRSFFFEARGYDEDFTWWGAEDGDMAGRARLAGLEHVWICDRTAMLHQWHPRWSALKAGPERKQELSDAWARNHRLANARADILSRNPGGWGGRSDDAQP